jgi:hypothetical protein
LSYSRLLRRPQGASTRGHHLATAYVGGFALPQLKVKSMKRMIFISCCVGMCLLAGQASAAFKFKRFPHCAEGLVTEKTCECRQEGSRHFHYCHAGQYCPRLTVPATNSRASACAYSLPKRGMPVPSPPQIISMGLPHSGAVDEPISETALTCA